MADRNLRIVVTGDAKSANQALESVGVKAESLGTKVNGMSTKAKAALVGVSLAAVKFGKDSIAAFTEAETSQANLDAAFAKFPQLAGANAKALMALNEQLQAKTVFDHEANASGQSVLAGFGLTEAQLRRVTPLLDDYAQRTGKDIPTAATDLGKAILGQGRALKSVGIQFQDTHDKGKNFDELVTGLTKHVGGFAETAGKTSSGQLKILSNQFKDLQEKVGALLVPALLKLADAGLKIVKFFQDLPGPVKDVLVGLAALALSIVVVNKGMEAWKKTTEAWTAVTKIATGVQWAFNAAMDANPIMLVVLGLAALVVALIVAYEKVGWFRDFVNAAFHLISDVVGAVVGFIRDHWQLLFQILTGPIGTAVLFIRGHWQTIKDDVMGVVHFIAKVGATIWDGLSSGLGGVISGIRAALSAMISFVIRIVNDAIQVWNDIPFHKDIKKIGDPSAGLIASGPHAGQDPHHLAAGGIVQARYGGMLAKIGEAGVNEAVLPLTAHGLAPFADALRSALASNGGLGSLIGNLANDLRSVFSNTGGATAIGNAGTGGPLVFQMVVDRQVLGQIVVTEAELRARRSGFAGVGF